MAYDLIVQNKQIVMRLQQVEQAIALKINEDAKKNTKDIKIKS